MQTDSRNMSWQLQIGRPNPNPGNREHPQKATHIKEGAEEHGGFPTTSPDASPQPQLGSALESRWMGGGFCYFFTFVALTLRSF